MALPFYFKIKDRSVQLVSLKEKIYSNRIEKEIQVKLSDLTSAGFQVDHSFYTLLSESKDVIGITSSPSINSFIVSFQDCTLGWVIKDYIDEEIMIKIVFNKYV